MRNRVLVLNQNYNALTVCSVPRAFILLYLRKAELVSGVEGVLLRSVSENYPYPSVIRLSRYVNAPYRGVVLSRNNIFRRDGLTCQYCGARNNLSLDHVLPKSRGGASNWKNLVTACRPCNARKGDKTPEEAGMPLRRRPFKPSFLLFLKEYSGNVEASWMTYLRKAG